MTPALPYLGRLPALGEFFTALGDSHTYDPRRNAFTLFGLFWGIPISIFSMVIDSWVIGHPHRIALFWEQPVHLLFLIHPLLFGIIFGAMGTVRQGQDRRIALLLKNQEGHVAQLAKANLDLKKLDELKIQFMANVTHELKTPLVAIRGYSESILEGRFGPLTSKQRDGLEVAVRNVGRLEKLIHELLEFERIDSNAYQPSLTDFDLIGLVRLVLTNFEPTIEAKHQTLQLRLPERLTVRADSEGIRHVLLNLLSNAVKFTQAGSSLGVNAKASEDGRQALVTVWDQGPGIPESARRFLFSRFWQADGSAKRKHGGTGLGLAIAKGILDAHGSTLQAASTPGSGTMMHFDLPLARSSGPKKELDHDHRETSHSRR
jgi:signal transduction histidine kinase